MNEASIWCPRCRWRPRAEHRWVCMPGCGTSWNTFWTGGVCPGCTHAWQNTQCLACARISPHRQWYHWPEKEPRQARAASSRTGEPAPS